MKKLLFVLLASTGFLFVLFVLLASTGFLFASCSQDLTVDKETTGL